MEVKGPHTYLVRVPGNNRRFVHADHLIPDDSRTQTPSECPPLDLEESSEVADMGSPPPVPAPTPLSDTIPSSLIPSGPPGGELFPRAPPRYLSFPVQVATLKNQGLFLTKHDLVASRRHQIGMESM